ncbi:MAG: hypothetical protein AAB400_04200 [Patescibacteria group bacterium]
MNTQIIELVQINGIEGLSGIPTMIETVVSRVFFFDTDDTVLKFYKRDNTWWNTEMQNISGGPSRINFIRGEFDFNHFLNPPTYIALKIAEVRNGKVFLQNPKDSDDELVIVMRKEDVSKTLTHVLAGTPLSEDEYMIIGRSFASIKLKLPRHFLPQTDKNWYELMIVRAQDLSEWVRSENNFPPELAGQGLALFEKMLHENKAHFETIQYDSLNVCIDCNSENVLYSNGELRFLDAYPPKEEWRIGTFDVDIYRMGSDIAAFAGNDAYKAYQDGVNEVARNHLDPELENFYLLYSALIMAPYLVMRSKNDQSFQLKAEEYTTYLRGLLASIA